MTDEKMVEETLQRLQAEYERLSEEAKKEINQDRLQAAALIERNLFDLILTVDPGTLILALSAYVAIQTIKPGDPEYTKVNIALFIGTLRHFVETFEKDPEVMNKLQPVTVKQLSANQPLPPNVH